ncbi:MAG: hypothetical protein ACJ8F2_05445, partial [Xanthobacteraceae bacterium]
LPPEDIGTTTVPCRCTNSAPAWLNMARRSERPGVKLKRFAKRIGADASRVPRRSARVFFCADPQTRRFAAVVEFAFPPPLGPRLLIAAAAGATPREQSGTFGRRELPGVTPPRLLALAGGVTERDRLSVSFWRTTDRDEHTQPCHVRKPPGCGIPVR